MSVWEKVKAAWVAATADRRARGTWVASGLLIVLPLALVGYVAVATLYLRLDIRVWGWAVGMIPALLVLQQMCYVYFGKGRARPTAAALKPVFQGTGDGNAPPVPDVRAAAQAKENMTATTAKAPEEAAARHRQAFNFWSILYQFGFPALLNVLCGLALVSVLGNVTLAPEDAAGTFSKSARDGLLYSGLGAYVYVLLYLTQRWYLRDITSGSATWCAATMVLGPVLGAVAAQVFDLKPGESSAVGNAQKALLFVTGLSPRYMVSVIGEVVRRLMQQTATSSSTLPRLISLSQIRGITPDIEERLVEEGIPDAAGLAMANPFRLVRNTPYHERQILAWIDEALLMLFVPQGWQGLENCGLTGAVDLAYGYYPEATRKALAKVAGMDDPVFEAMMYRAAADAQVALLAYLYHAIGSQDGD